MLQELPPTWRVARKVYVSIMSIANSITLSILIVLAGLTTLYLKLSGLTWSHLDLQDNWTKYVGVLLAIHFGPVCIYATKRVLTKRFRDFRVVVVDDKKVGDGIE